MGAHDFFNESEGENPAEAFQAARDQALYEYGHGGYTGTIAEKDGFVLVALPAGQEPYAFAREFLERDAHVGDKWGPAGCIPLGPRRWLFFGLASS